MPCVKSLHEAGAMERARAAQRITVMFVRSERYRMRFGSFRAPIERHVSNAGCRPGNACFAI